MRTLLVLLLVVVGVALGVYVSENSGATEVHFIWWRWTAIPTWYPAVAAAAGVCVAFLTYVVLAGLGWRVRHLVLHRSRMEQDATVRELRRENRRLRMRGTRTGGEARS